MGNNRLESQTTKEATNMKTNHKSRTPTQEVNKEKLKVTVW